MQSPLCQMDKNNLSRVFGPTIVGHGMAEPSPMTIMRDTNIQPMVGTVLCMNVMQLRSPFQYLAVFLKVFLSATVFPMIRCWNTWLSMSPIDGNTISIWRDASVFVKLVSLSGHRQNAVVPCWVLETPHHGGEGPSYIISCWRQHQ